jgi:hypothetical protein
LPDFFSYPRTTDYAFIVANDIVPLATPDKWRHNLSAILNQGGSLLRVTIVGCEFPGRCFDCKLNNKSVCFCFFGQNTKDGDRDVDLTPELKHRLNRIERFVAFRAANNVPGARLPVEHFPDPDIIFEVKSTNRVSKQHYLPPVINLLRQAPFTNHFDEHIFDGMLGTRAHVTIGQAQGSWRWSEPESDVKDRVASLASIKEMASLVERRAQVALLMKALYKQWTDQKGGAKCNAQCWRAGCVDCKQVRGALKREYKEHVREAVDARIKHLFTTSTGPFSAFVHSDFNGAYYEDASCRVASIVVET